MAGLVGRQRELTTLTGLLATGRGGVVLIAGEPGIGKTSLLEAFADEAARRAFAVAWGRAWEVSMAPPYWPWIEAIRELVARGHDASMLVDLLPDLRRDSRPTVDADPLRLYDAIVAFLQSASSREPIAILLDDLHAADPSSLRLAEFVAPHLRRMRVVLAGSYRDLEVRRSEAIETALARIGRRGETLHLARLDVASVGELVRNRIGHDDEKAARMIHDASDGNPLFVSELLKLLAGRGSASRDVPAGVRAVIRERLALLSPATVALLQAAAIIGRTFSVTVAADIAGVTPVALDEAISETITMEVVEPIEAGRYRFSHALVAETLVAELPAAVRAKLHRRAAETLERLHAGDPLAPLADIARHWIGAGIEHAERAVTAAVRAAESATLRLAFDDAAARYDDALASLAVAAPNDLSRRSALLVAQGEAFVRGGDRARAAGPCTVASEIAQSVGDSVLFARAALAFGADAAVATIDAALIKMLERALVLLPATDNPWRAKVSARLAAARQPMDDPEQPMALAREAIAMARRLGDPAVLRDVVFAAVGAFVDFAQPSERAALNTELLDLLDGDTPRTLRTLQRLAFDHIELGDLAAFEQIVARYEALGDATGQLRYQWAPHLFRAMRAHWEGRDEDAERESNEAYAIRTQLGDESVPMLRAIRTALLSNYARLEVPLEQLVAALTTPMPLGSQTVRAAAYLAMNRRDEAARDYAWLRANTSPHRPAYHLLDAYAEVAWAFRDRELAACHMAAATPYEGRAQLVSSVGFMFLGVIDHGLMRSALVLGQRDLAQRYRDSAVALCDRLGARAVRMQIEQDFGGAPPPKSSTAIQIAREGEFWTVSGLGELCRIKDSRGIQMLARLVAAPNQEHHVLDLVGAELVDGGDAGTVIDRAARDQYMSRIRELQADLAQAHAWNDAGRRERLEAELDALADQLTNAYGLGGREKRSGSATERARTNVRRRLTDAMQRIEEAAPALGRHFTRSVRTGVMCVYDPNR